MKIYTKTGDKGDTSLFGGTRIPKSSLRIDAYGTVDELNAQLGVVCSINTQSEVEIILKKVQIQLFVLGSDLSTPLDVSSPKVKRIQNSDIQWIEETIDKIDGQLLPLNSFILPGGSVLSAQLHVARTVCRRAERRIDVLSRKEDIGALPLIFLNRLADMLFVLARYVNILDGKQEEKWSDG